MKLKIAVTAFLITIFISSQSFASFGRLSCSFLSSTHWTGYVFYSKNENGDRIEVEGVGAQNGSIYTLKIYAVNTGATAFLQGTCNDGKVELKVLDTQFPKTKNASFRGIIRGTVDYNTLDVKTQVDGEEIKISMSYSGFPG